MFSKCFWGYTYNLVVYKNYTMQKGFALDNKNIKDILVLLFLLYIKILYFQGKNKQQEEKFIENKAIICYYQ